MYGAPIWGTSTGQNIGKVQAAQIKVARMSTGTTLSPEKKEHRQTILNKLGWPNVDQIILNSTANLVRKAGLNQSSLGLNKAIKRITQQSSRNSNYMRLGHTGPIKRKQDIFSANGVQIFNNLPKELRNPLLNDKQFKVKMKEYSLSTKSLKEH